MDYRIAVCDDEPQARELAQACAVQWAHKHGYSVEVRQFPTGDAFLFQYEEDKAWDILLLDVEMPGCSGVELAKAVRQQNKRTQIVFITGYADYIAEGYDVSALHYLLKPLDREKLFSVLGRAAERLHQSGRALLLELPEELVRVPLYEVEYLEVRGNYVTVSISNPCSGRVVLKNGVPQTSKDDIRYHGFGTRSMKYIVEKYGGNIVFSEKDGVFGVYIIFPLSDKTSAA